MLTSDPKSNSRREVLAILGGAAIVPLVPGSAFAMSTKEATTMIETVVREIMSAVNSGQSEARILAQFKTIFLRYADVPIIARSVLGAPWRTATDAQKQAFVSAFQDYLADKYGRRFHAYEGATVTVTRASDQGDKGILVNSTVKSASSAPFAVDWQVSDRGGSKKLINIFIEGISMLSTERSEIRAMLEAKRNSVDGLIATLKG